jgi:hypothetical protein
MSQVSRIEVSKLDIKSLYKEVWVDIEETQFYWIDMIKLSD